MARTGLVNCGKKQRIFSRVCGNGKMVGGNGGVVGGNPVVVDGKVLRLLGQSLQGTILSGSGWCCNSLTRIIKSGEISHQRLSLY